MTGVLMGEVQGASGAGSGYSVLATPGFVSVPGGDSGTITATITGGASPFTYQWVVAPSSGMKITSPHASTTNVTENGTSARTVSLACTVKDNNGKFAYSNAVSIDFYYNPSGNPL